jgi:hypothetical protein
MKKFFYMTDGKTQQGPIEYAKLLEMKKRGELPAGTRICAEGSSIWQPLPSTSKANSIVYFVTGLILVGFIGYLLQQHDNDQTQKQTDASAQMAQKALESGTLTDYQANNEYDDAMKLLQAGSYQSALMELNSAISVKGTDPRFYDARAKAKEALGDHDGAAADTKTADDLKAKASAPTAP